VVYVHEKITFVAMSGACRHLRWLSRSKSSQFH
jgi:hypothetical protein